MHLLIRRVYVRISTRHDRRCRVATRASATPVAHQPQQHQQVKPHADRATVAHTCSQSLTPPPTHAPRPTAEHQQIPRPEVSVRARASASIIDHVHTALECRRAPSHPFGRAQAPQYTFRCLRRRAHWGTLRCRRQRAALRRPRRRSHLGCRRRARSASWRRGARWERADRRTWTLWMPAASRAHSFVAPRSRSLRRSAPREPRR
jgi:hypothetical protein